MVVHAERMRENLERSRGVVFSGTVLLELARRGFSREQAYEWVQRNAMRSFDEQSGLQDAAARRPGRRGVLPPAEIEKAFDLDDQLRNVERSSTACLRGGSEARDVLIRRRGCS